MPETVSSAADLDLISFLRAIPDTRMRRGVRIPAWYLLLLLGVLGILSRCQSLRDLERFAKRHRIVLTEALGIELRRPPSDSAFRYFFQQVDVAALCAAIRDWTIAQIPGGCPPYPKAVFWQLQEQGADFLLTVKATQKTLHRRIHSQFQGKRRIPFLATDCEKSHGRDITWTLRAKPAPESIRAEWIATSWIVEVVAEGAREGKPFHVTHLSLTSLRTTPEALLQLVRDRWSLEGWHWIRDTQLNDDAHRYGGYGADALATLRTAAMNLLRLEGFQSIRAGMQAVMHDITELLKMALRQPVPNSDLRL